MLSLKAELYKKKGETSHLKEKRHADAVHQDPYTSIKKTRRFPKDGSSALSGTASSYSGSSAPGPSSVSSSSGPCERELEYSRKALSEKSAKYRQMLIRSTHLLSEEEKQSSLQDNPEVLVDFDGMSFENMQRFLKSKSDDDDDDGDHRSGCRKMSRPVSSSSINLVEVVDEFGRTRMVTPAQAEACQKKASPSPYISSQAAHYDSNFEIRDKSVSFYKFSLDEDQRKEQMKALKHLDYMTFEQRSSIQKQRERHLSERQRRISYILSLRHKLLNS